MTLRKRFPRFGVSRFGVLPLACYTKKVAARSYSRNSAARPGQAENHREVAMQSALRPDSSVVERGPEKAGVGGSIPSLATTSDTQRFILCLPWWRALSFSGDFFSPQNIAARLQFLECSGQLQPSLLLILLSDKFSANSR